MLSFHRTHGYCNPLYSKASVKPHLTGQRAKDMVEVARTFWDGTDDVKSQSGMTVNIGHLYEQ